MMIDRLFQLTEIQEFEAYSMVVDSMVVCQF